MSEEIHLNRLALVITRPVYWDIEPEPHARGLGTFLRLLLTVGGSCVLGEVTGEQRRTNWLTPDAALDWVNVTEDYYVELAPLLRQLGSGTYRLFIQRRCWLFFDHECLLAALDRSLDQDKWQGEPIAPDVERLSHVLENSQVSPPELQAMMQKYLEEGSRLYISFSVDFSTSGVL